MLGSDAFGMELHAMHRQRAMREPHDQPSSVSAVTLRSAGKVCAIDDQRMIARRVERPIDAAKHAFALWLISESLPCTGTGARTTLPPKAWPIA